MNKSIGNLTYCLLIVALVIITLSQLLIISVKELEENQTGTQQENLSIGVWFNDTVPREPTKSNVSRINNRTENTPVSEFHFKQITRAELEQILAETSIESIPRNHSFVCVDFTNELIKELLLKRGVQACQANIYFKAPTNHAFLAVNTSDEGIIYVEPQNDNILNWNDLIFHYTYMTRVTSCFGRQIPEPYECVYMDGIKKCNLAHSW